LLRIEYQRTQWAKNHKINENNKIERYCTQCKEWKEETLNNFYYKNKKKPEMGFTPICRICARKKSIINGNNNKERRAKWSANYYENNKEIDNERSKKWAKNNYEYDRKRQSQWRKDNPDKCIEYTKLHRNHDITDTEWNSCLETFGHKCAFCKISEEEHLKIHKQVLHKEHSDDQGYNDLRNAIPACRSCNSSKHQDKMETWFRKQESFSEEKLAFIIWWTTEGYKKFIEENLPIKLLKRKMMTTINFTGNYGVLIYIEI